MNGIESNKVPTAQRLATDHHIFTHTLLLCTRLNEYTLGVDRN